ncbi:MAG: dihydrolipoamide acetyltransferase family protein [Propionicimonas sp.]
MFEFKLPDPGEGLIEAEIVAWKVAVGDVVAVNDILLEIETAKSLVELPSPHAGTVLALLVAEGDMVDVGTPVIRIGEPGEAPDGTAPTEPEDARPAATSTEPEVSGRVHDSNGDPVEPEAPVATLVGYGAKPGAIARRARKGHTAAVRAQTEQVHESYTTDYPVSRPVDRVEPLQPVTASPSGEVLPPPGQPTGGGEVPRPPLAKPPVRRVARDLGVDLATVVGTGPAGLVTHEDVIAAAGAQGRVESPGATQRVPLRGVRREMFRTMTQSLSVPQATAWVEVDVTATMDLLATLRERPEFRGLRVSPLLIFAKAACLAIARNPEINSGFDADAEEILIHSDVNLGIAAATPRGLIVPNVKRANRMGLHELATALNQLIAVAKEGRAQPSDFTQGTFTITNVGVFGVDAGTPIMNPGEAAILCVGAVVRRPWVVGSGDNERIEPRSVCTLALSFDHRLVDGETASRFLADVGTILADPGLAMLF